MYLYDLQDAFIYKIAFAIWVKKKKKLEMKILWKIQIENLMSL